MNTELIPVVDPQAQLPLWSHDKRGTPNSFLRSALFSAKQGKDRLQYKEAILASQKGIVVKYTGEQLNQEDLSVWEAMAHMARTTPLGYISSFSAYSILQTLGLSDGKENYKTLNSTIIRLKACAMMIQHEGKTFGGSPVDAWVMEEDPRRYQVRLSKDLINLFGKTQWTAVDWEQRYLLRKKSLAQALHGFYSTHSRPFNLKLATLALYVGSSNKQPAGFKIKVFAALTELIYIGFLESFKIEDDMVSVKRTQKALEHKA